MILLQEHLFAILTNPDRKLRVCFTYFLVFANFQYVYGKICVLGNRITVA